MNPFRGWSASRLRARLGLASGIVWAGPVYDAAGYGNVSRNYLLGLDRLGVPLRVHNHGERRDDVLDARVVARLRRLRRGRVGPRPVLVVHHQPEQYEAVRVPEAVARIGICIFETDRIPAHWAPLCNEMDAIWVPSEFNRRTFMDSGVDPAKLEVIPYSVDTDFYAPGVDPYPIPDLRGFSFLYVSFFDWRKGFDLMLEAYLGEFTRDDDVSLVIRTSFPDTRDTTSVRDRLFSMIEDRVDLSRDDLPHLVLITEALHQDELRALYQTCDLYISTDRANGWGMPCMEAMSMGKPAATIDWSGSTEFMKEDNSLLIRPTGRLEPVDPRLVQARGDLYTGHRWAEVEVAEVRRVMRHAFEHRKELAPIAERGCAHVRGQLDLVSVARRVVRAADRLRG